MTSSNVMDVPVDVTPVSAPPVALKIPVGLPLPSPIKNASSSFVPILLPNSLEMYCSILNTLSFRFSIYKIGKPRELTYNAKVDNYNFGVVAGSGLNLIAALKEKGIDVEVKAIAKLMKFEKMERL